MCIHDSCDSNARADSLVMETSKQLSFKFLLFFLLIYLKTVIIIFTIFFIYRMAVADPTNDFDAPLAKKAKLFAPPTIEEISDLRESEGIGLRQTEVIDRHRDRS